MKTDVWNEENYGFVVSKETLQHNFYMLMLLLIVLDAALI